MSGMYAMLPLTQVLRAGERRENVGKRKTEGDRDTTVCSLKTKKEKTGDRDTNVMCSAPNFHTINNSS